jgi:hypothetical protein
MTEAVRLDSSNPRVVAHPFAVYEARHPFETDSAAETLDASVALQCAWQKHVLGSWPAGTEAAPTIRAFTEHLAQWSKVSYYSTIQPTSMRLRPSTPPFPASILLGSSTGTCSPPLSRL